VTAHRRNCDADGIRQSAFSARVRASLSLHEKNESSQTYLYDDGGRRACPDVRRDEERIQEPCDFSLRVESHATRRTAASVVCVQKARVQSVS